MAGPDGTSDVYSTIRTLDDPQVRSNDPTVQAIAMHHHIIPHKKAPAELVPSGPG
jgi:hypothetical protein